MSIVKLGFGSTNEALEYAKRAIATFLKDPNRPKDVIVSLDLFLALAFIAKGNALAMPT
ncbi:hypothetical protein [Rickettsia endosymbiont of Gonocerus acuteangulatus]|uniref:hypothetical protein n=1 Tax=Rickettsia endosymbiont of Gonocerus acuteangulatus TaxID=3066266 RepID=UPI003132AC01